MPASSAALAGAWAPIAFMMAALATVAITLCYAEPVARVPTSGGQAGLTEVAFGRYASFLAGALTYVANLLAAGAITAAAVDMVAELMPALSAGLGNRGLGDFVVRPSRGQSSEVLRRHVKQFYTDLRETWERAVKRWF